MRHCFCKYSPWSKQERGKDSPPRREGELATNDRASGRLCMGKNTCARMKGSSQSHQRTTSARGTHDRGRAQRCSGAVTMQEKDHTLFFERTTCERIAFVAH